MQCVIIRKGHLHQLLLYLPFTNSYMATDKLQCVYKLHTLKSDFGSVSHGNYQAWKLFAVFISDP